MCGICGIVALDPSPGFFRPILDAMVAALEHRGPDDGGSWVSDDRRVALGNRRLSIVDLGPAGHQPMANADGSVRVTFNGEIYNFAQLRGELEAKGYRFRSRCDTEVLVHLYDELGGAMVERLDGDFSFAIWDARRGRLLLARDRAGVHPLYYAELGRGFVFASEIKSLIHHPEVGREIDEASLYHYLTYLVAPPPRTLLAGVRKLPAAGVLTLELGESSLTMQTGRHWEPFPGPMEVDTNDLDGQLQELFDRSVEKRLMSDVPVGVLFSGGIDSSLNALSFQQRIEPERVRTYTVGMRDGSGAEDEAATAREVAALLGTEHHEVTIDENDLIATARALAAQQDEPVSDPVAVPLYFVTRLARETGTIVLHAGEGADELFCGYDGYRRFLRWEERLWRPLSRLPGFVSHLGFRALRGSRVPRQRKIADVLRRRALDQELFLSAAVAYYEHEKASILARGFRERLAGIDSFDVVAPLYRRLAEHHPNATMLQRMTYVELQLRLPELLLMRMDKMSMANSVEARVPFLDRDLVDFALSVPESFKLRGGVSKEPLKRMLAAHLGRERAYRPKRGFGVPIRSWFQTRLGEDLRRLLQEDRSEAERFFDVARVIARLDRGPRTVNEAFQLWVIYNLLNWRRGLIDS